MWESARPAARPYCSFWLSVPGKLVQDTRLMAYAIIKADGKSFRVAVGDKVNMNHLDLEEGATATFDQVLAFGEGENLRLGTPTLEGASVTAKVTKQFKAPKVIVFHFKRRKGYHKKKGHRQPMTELEITGINA